MLLSRRTHVLLDEGRYRLLRRRAQQRGTSVGSLIREAIDRTYGPAGEADADAKRREALVSFLAAEPMPVTDWPEMEHELESLRERDGRAT